MSRQRKQDLDAFYSMIAPLPRLTLPAALDSGPSKGIYLLFEPGERREDGSPRVVRVGSQGLSEGQSSTLQSRLRQHAGTRAGGGHHRSSVLRRLAGPAIAVQRGLSLPTGWGGPRPATTAAREAEKTLEAAVSLWISRLEVVFLTIPDPPGAGAAAGPALRRHLEEQSIALLSNHERPALDPPSARWTGHHSHRPLLRSSGLWNQNHVQKVHDPAFLDLLAAIVRHSLAPA